MRARFTLPRGPAVPAAGHSGRWAASGAVLGLTLGLLAFAPASWLASAIATASQQRVQLIDAQGTIWHGSALPMLAGPVGSRDASVLPARLHWSATPIWLGLRLQLQQAGHIDQPLRIDWHAGWGRQQLSVPGGAGPLGRWPASWLAGLGAPVNTLKPDGELQLLSPGFSLESDAQGWRLQGQLQLSLLGFSSRLSTIEPLGSYQLQLQSQGERRIGLRLSTLEGALRLSGQGEIGAKGLRLRGEAQAAPGQEAPLNNLLNIIGRREGALSRISIG